MVILKVIGFIFAGLVVIAIFLFGGGIWMIRSSEKDRFASIEILKREFPEGADVASLIDRAAQLKAGGYTLYEMNEAGGESVDTRIEIARADSMFDGIEGREPKFPAQFESIKTKFRQTKNGQIVIDFPVFMNARWIFDAKFADGKVTVVRTLYLD